MKHITDTIKLLADSPIFYVIIVGMDSKYTYASKSYNNNFSFLGESLEGRDFSITLHPDDIKICAEVGEQCFAEPNKLFPATLRKHDGKGGYVFTQWELKAVFSPDGIPEGIFCIGYNITEQMQAIKELIIAKTEIEDKTDKLNEIGFIQSHVIRKPLANVMGLSSVLSNMNLEADAKLINNMLLKSAHELDEVIRNVVDKTA
jgi:PAS domain S-box-containing protein